MKRIVSQFTLTFILFLAATSGYSQGSGTKLIPVYFVINSVEVTNDTAIAILDDAGDYNIKNGSSVKAYQKWLAKAEGFPGRNFGQVGAGRIVQNDKYIVAFVKLDDPQKQIGAGDLIEIDVSVPNLANRSVFSDLAFLQIFFTDNSQQPFYDLRTLLTREKKEYIDSLYVSMSANLKEIYELIKGTSQGDELSAVMTTGNFAGKSILQMLQDAKKEDIESFLFFVYSFPAKYMSEKYKLSETYATWLLNEAPKSHKEVINKLLPIYKNKLAFRKALDKFRADISEDGHVTSIVNEAVTLQQNGKEAEASEMMEFAFAVANEVGDNDGKAWYFLLRAEMIHDRQNYMEALPFCDSAVRYALKAGNKEYELNARNKKLFCLVYGLQFKQAEEYGTEVRKILEQYKTTIKLSTYNNNLLKNYEYRGMAFYKNGEYSKAIDEFTKVVEEHIKINSYSSLNRNGYFYKLIGQVKNDQGTTDAALENFFKAARIYKLNADTFQLAYVQSEIAYSYNKKGEYKKSLEYAAVSRENSIAAEDNVNIGYTYSVDGSSYWSQGDYKKAEASHKKSIEYREKTRNYALQGDSWNKLGALYLESGSKTLALQAYDSSIAKYRKVNDNNSIADVYNKQGKLYANDENYAVAVEYYEKASGISTKATADAYYNLAIAWMELDSLKSRKNFEQCIKSCKETENISLEFDASYGFALLAYNAGNSAVADALYERCLTISKELQLQSSIADCYNLKAYGLKTQTDLDGAASYYQKAIAIYDSVNPTSAVYGWENLATINTSKGDFKVAISDYNKAIDLSKKISNQLAYGSVMGASSFVYGLVGEFDLGLKNSDTALRIFTETGNITRLANTYISRGTLLENQGKYKDAIRSFQIADSIYVLQKLNDYRSTAFTNMGVVYHKQGDHENSLKHHKKAFDLLKKNVVDETYLLSAGNVAEALVYLKKYPEAEKELLRILPLAKEKKINRILSGLDLALGKLYYETNEMAKARPFYQESYDYAVKSNEKEKIVDALTHLGLIHLKENSLKLAEENFAAAAKVTEDFQIAYGWESYYQLGLIYYNQKNFEQSIVYFKKAASQLDRNTENLYGGEAAAKIYNNDPRKADLYEKLTFAYYNTGNVAEAWNYANRSNIAGIKELSGSLSTTTNDAEKNEALKKLVAMQQQKKQLEETLKKQKGEERLTTIKKIEIQENDYKNFLDDVVSKYQDLGVYLTRSNADEFNSFVGKLPADVAVLLYLQNNNTLMIFSLTNEKLAVDTMTIDLNAKVTDFIKTIKNTGKQTGTGSLALRSEPVDEEEPKETEDFKKQSNNLYDILIGSVQDKIKDKTKLCIIPSGIFSNLPFQCLGKSGTNNEFNFLIENYGIFYTNKMSIFKGLDQTAQRPNNLNSFAAFGTPDPTLTYNVSEVKEIGKILNGESNVYADSRATESQAKTSLREKKYIHFATHGVLNYSTDFAQSYLKLLPDADTSTGNNGKLTIREIQSVGIKDCDMVILSACETAVSMQLVKGWNISPANSFLGSNVKTVVATLWKVADEPTGLLMQYFYENLSKSASVNKLDALRQAQVKLSQNPKFAHPNYWGAFVLYGDWR